MTSRALYQLSELKMRFNMCLKVFDSSLHLYHQGATIRRDEATGAVIVARIMRGGAADRSGETNSIINIYHSANVSCILLFSLKKTKIPTQQDLLISTDILTEVRRLRCVTP